MTSTALIPHQAKKTNIFNEPNRQRDGDNCVKDMEKKKADSKVIYCILSLSECVCECVSVWVCECVCVCVCVSWSWLDSVLATGMPTMIQHIACMFRGMTVAAH